jgi:polyisoprenyl-phosphate glycosyltransferase
MQLKTVILIPVYNDELSLNILLSNLKTSLGPIREDWSVLLIDDGATSIHEIQKDSGFPIQVLHLQRNIGHQKALAIGLAYIKDNLSCDKVLVMDADGQDRPEDAFRLLQECILHPGKIIFARRKSRQEGGGFRLFYRLYKFMFSILTGKKIAYGNFLVVPKPLLDKLVFYSEIWNHLAGGIIRSGLPYVSLQTDRGKRYAGQSKMGFQSLLLHGFGAIAVFIDIIASRLLVFSLLLIGLSLAAIIVLICIKSFTHLAIPGWTSTVLTAMLIILLQSFLISLFTVFLYLSSQSQRKFIPALHYKDYCGELETIS